MNQIVTQAIILSRTNYGEADRIITLLTPDQGKLRLMARGVRKVKSKLAGGIELFSISDITFIRGKGEIGTLVSTRLRQHYGRITKDIDRVQLGYGLIKTLNKATEDHPEAGYFELLGQAFAALDSADIGSDLIQLWFEAQLLRLSGHTPNLRNDTLGNKLDPTVKYIFDFDSMAFAPAAAGRVSANEIKFLRLCFADHQPKILARIEDSQALIERCRPQVRQMVENLIRT